MIWFTGEVNGLLNGAGVVSHCFLLYISGEAAKRTMDVGHHGRNMRGYCYHVLSAREACGFWYQTASPRSGFAARTFPSFPSLIVTTV